MTSETQAAPVVAGVATAAFSGLAFHHGNVGEMDIRTNWARLQEKHRKVGSSTYNTEDNPSSLSEKKDSGAYADGSGSVQYSKRPFVPLSFKENK